MRVSRDEIFGPVQCISKWSSMDEVGGLGVRAARVIVCVGGQARGGAAQNATSSRLNTHTHTHTHTQPTRTHRSSAAPTTPCTAWRLASSPPTSTQSTRSRAASVRAPSGAQRVCVCVCVSVCVSLKRSKRTALARTHAHTHTRLRASQGKLLQHLRRRGAIRRLQGAHDLHIYGQMAARAWLPQPHTCGGSSGSSGSWPAFAHA